MRLQLYIMRHAEAEHTLGIKDFDRSLTKNGRAEAANTAALLAQKFSAHTNSMVISSPAKRALETAEILLHAQEVSLEKIRLEMSIYEASTQELLLLINRIPEGITKALIVGHNPGLSSLISYLTASYITLKTGQFALLEIEPEFTFSMISMDTAQLVDVIG